MILLIALLLVFSLPGVILLLERRQVRLGYIWLTAVGGTFVVWVLMWFARLASPVQIVLVRWEAGSLLRASITLLLDEISWPYAIGLSALYLVMVLGDVFNLREVEPRRWAGGIGLGLGGLLAVLAANPLTLMLAWVGMDIVEMVIWLRRVRASRERERIVIGLAVRLGGVMLVWAAAALALAAGRALTFREIPPLASGVLLLAAGLRLGVLPPHQILFRQAALPRGLGTVIRLAPVASSLALLGRVAQSPTLAGGQFLILAMTMLAALCGGLGWAGSDDVFEGRGNWLLGMSALALFNAARGLPQASLAWGMAALLAGAVLFFVPLSSRVEKALAGLGALGVLALPLTLSSDGGAVLAGVTPACIVFFVLAHALLFLGFARFLFKEEQGAHSMEPWMRGVSLAGVVILLATWWGSAWLAGLFRLPAAAVSLPAGLSALTLLLAGGIAWVGRRSSSRAEQALAWLQQIIALGWLYRLFWGVYRALTRLAQVVSQVLEGEGGVLWAILVLILLVSVLRQVGGNL